MTPRRMVIASFGAALLAAGIELAAQQSAGRFTVVDVYVESNEPLAAWQFELAERAGRMQVVGIEGGGNAVFGEPPFYDRNAVDTGSADRIVVADFSLRGAGELPSGRTRVARVHVRLEGAESPDYDLTLVAAGAADGRPIAAAISFDFGAGR